MAAAGATSPAASLLGAAVSGDIVTVTVGPEKKLFRLHKDLLCYHSEYFRSAYSGRWEGSERGATLDDVEPEVFLIFVHWLYKKPLPGTPEEIVAVTGNATKNCNNDKKKGWSLVIKACIFGDRFLAPAFKQAANNLYAGKLSPSWYEHIRYAFDNLKEDDLLLKFMVDAQCLKWRPHHDTHGELLMRELLPNVFLVRVMIRTHELETSKTTWKNLKRCSYHYHKSEEEREGCPNNTAKKTKI